MDSISERGVWLSTDLHGHFDDVGLAAALQEFFRGRSVIDFGCGTGFYVKMIGTVAECRGYDGNPFTPELTGHTCEVLDLSHSVDVSSAEWVLSLEVAEHIPRQYEDVFVQNLDRHNTKGIILSWAHEGQGGIGHVNERNQNYVVGRFADLGYEQDEQLTRSLRAAATFHWLRDNLLALRRAKGRASNTLVRGGRTSNGH